MFKDDKAPGEAPVKDDIWNLQRFIRWLETMPAGEAYDFYDSRKCLLFQYSGQVFSSVLYCDDVPKPFGHVATRTPHTFGAALQRARAIAQEER